MSDPSPTDWAPRRAPTLADIEALAETALARLPAGFRRLSAGVVLRVDDFADDEALRDLGMESPYELLGLFRGVGLAQDEAVAGTGRLPNIVWLYRRPLLDEWAEGEETLGALVTHVLVHEIGHHFGLSDADMERVEREARPR